MKRVFLNKNEFFDSQLFDLSDKPDFDSDDKAMMIATDDNWISETKRENPLARSIPTLLMHHRQRQMKIILMHVHGCALGSAILKMAEALIITMQV